MSEEFTGEGKHLACFDISAISSSRQRLLKWYGSNGREMPWRGIEDPWLILLSEVLLQQTRVGTISQLWGAMVERFPSPKSMATSSEEQVLKAWQGCGYYRRARYLRLAAIQIVETGFPQSREQLLDLPGVGPYTSAAVSSIAFGEPAACVDGNVRRVISRLLGWEEARPQAIKTCADELLDQSRPGDWNQAMMDLGSLICTPRNPNCESCPLTEICLGKSNPTQYPSPRKRPVTQHYGAAIILNNNGRIWLNPRPSGLLEGMWSPPISFEKAPLHNLAELIVLELGDSKFHGIISHRLSHQHWEIEVYSLNTTAIPLVLGKYVLPNEKPLSNLDRRIINLALGPHE